MTRQSEDANGCDEAVDTGHDGIMSRGLELQGKKPHTASLHVISMGVIEDFRST